MNKIDCVSAHQDSDGRLFLCVNDDQGEVFFSIYHTHAHANPFSQVCYDIHNEGFSSIKVQVFLGAISSKVQTPKFPTIQLAWSTTMGRVEVLDDESQFADPGYWNWVNDHFKKRPLRHQILEMLSENELREKKRKEEETLKQGEEDLASAKYALAKKRSRQR